MATQAEKANEARYNIRVLDRAFRILELLSDGKPRSHLEVSEGIGLSPSTTFRLLATLSYYSYTKREERTNQYSLGLACLELARAYQDSNDLRRVAIPELESLRDDTKETVHLCVLDHMEIVYLEKLSGLHAIGIMSSQVGGRAPAHCTGVGKVLLAYAKPEVVESYFRRQSLERYTETTITSPEDLEKEMSRIRENGYAIDHGEHEPDVRCVAAPIFDISGEAVAALSISGPRHRMEPLSENARLIEQAKQTAWRISRQLGYQPGS